MASIDTRTLADFVHSPEPDLLAKTGPFAEYIHGLQSRGEYSYHRTLVSGAGCKVNVFDDHAGKERELISLAANNYLGIAERPEPVEAACAATRKYGTGLCGSRFLSGTYDLVQQLERELADFEDYEEVAVFTTGYQANVGVLAALLRKTDLVVIDRLSHASIVDGCRIAGCKFRTFHHNDAKSLDQTLERHGENCRDVLVVVEGVFSMDGDMCPLPEIMEVVERHGAYLMLDDAHATGVLGSHGAGTVDHFGLARKPDILVGTFSKSLSATGGYVAASHDVINYIRHYGRSYMFSASPAPGTIAAVRESLRILRAEPQLRETLWQNVNFISDGLKSAGFTLYPDPPQSAILTILIGEDAVVHGMSRDLYEGGLLTSTVVYPAVSPNEGKMRLSLSASHTKEALTRALEVITAAGRRHGII
jgi:glycine C-acetyltransferase